MWYAEYRHKDDDNWTRIRPDPWRSQEPAKAACKKMIKSNPLRRYQVHFRTVDTNGVAYQESKAPHDCWRMRWRDVPGWRK